MIIYGRCVPGYTVPTDAEYSLLRKAMALYAEYDYKSDDETINKIALAIGRKPKTAQKMIAGGMRNMMFTDFYRQYADEDGEASAEDVTVDSTTEPSRMFYHKRRLKILCEAFDNLEYRVNVPLLPNTSVFAKTAGASIMLIL